MTQRAPDQNNILEDAWGQVVGGMDWLKSVLLGEFADHRPLSVIVADMLVSFIPGVVIVTSARDAVAVILRLARHPEKRDDLLEWVLLSACMIVIALPVAMAAAGLAAAGVGAIVGGIAGSELGAALRAVMLLLIKEASKLVELVQFLQKFIKGDIIKFLRAIDFVKYEKPLLQALNKLTGKLVSIVKSLRTHLESLSYFDAVKATIAKLKQWEDAFYEVQRAAIRQIPKALAELNVRLAKVLTQMLPKEAHTVAAGVSADKNVVVPPTRQRVRDTPGNVLAHTGEGAPAAGGKATGKGGAKAKPKAAAKAETKPKPPLKDKPEPPPKPPEGTNTKKQVAADVKAAADRERITQLSNEALEAEKRGDTALKDKKIGEAQDILRPYFPKKNSNETWDEVIKRLDVASPKDGAVFWSGTARLADDTGKPDAARAFAEKIGGVTLETTPGGRIVDGWKEINVDYPWNEKNGPPPFASELWQGISTNYAQSATGNVNVVQTADKLRADYTVWYNFEKGELISRRRNGLVNDINIHVANADSTLTTLGKDEVEDLLFYRK
ncbi:hypothetical protein ACFFTM_05775 [Pseudoduganella plicata]|uniref:Uncharacterized protein n=1 Tax=Pseudoduganella plicata TaxID=321984 RepID=A0A4P7BIE9_9BURK|nr:hypothetical protein [Pseudoduganella plicata]QBQ38634.1 hypothetical protein E1742_22520 [Pseudoduganella plicata]GGY83810.1 hypothetical protein GCM10007388_16070 [Pseudoduganella plicata]